MLLDCKYCEAVVDAQPLKSYEYFDPEGGVHGKYSFLKCPKCENPFVTLQENYGKGWDDPVRIHPSPDTRVNPNLPLPIRTAYEEASLCIKSKAYTASAIMCRKTLEGICAEHGITGGNLVTKLKKMKDKGIIENRLYEWADELRISGNEAAHDVKITIAAEDAKDILDFTNALLEYIFTFRDKFEQYKKRRSSKSTKLPV